MYISSNEKNQGLRYTLKIWGFVWRQFLGDDSNRQVGLIYYYIYLHGQFFAQKVNLAKQILSACFNNNM